MVEAGFGRAGDPKKVTRTVRVDVSDAMRFTPARPTAERGETVKFVVQNSGDVPRELVLGTMEDLQAHAEPMRKHPGMEHDEPFMTHVAPGRTGEVVWQFSTPGEFHYGCLVPGHLAAGTVGRITVRRRTAPTGAAFDLDQVELARIAIQRNDASPGVCADGRGRSARPAHGRRRSVQARNARRREVAK